MNLHVYTTKWFARFARREGIPDAALCEAVERADKGLIDADLGGSILKQRIARQGSGRSGGYRTILLLRIGVRAIFAYGFAKNDRTNIGNGELEGFRSLAAELMGYEDAEIEKALDAGALLEVGLQWRQMKRPIAVTHWQRSMRQHQTFTMPEQWISVLCDTSTGYVLRRLNH